MEERKVSCSRSFLSLGRTGRRDGGEEGGNLFLVGREIVGFPFFGGGGRGRRKVVGGLVKVKERFSFDVISATDFPGALRPVEDDFVDAALGICSKGPGEGVAEEVDVALFDGVRNIFIGFSTNVDSATVVVIMPKFEEDLIQTDDLLVDEEVLRGEVVVLFQGHPFVEADRRGSIDDEEVTDDEVIRTNGDRSRV